MAEFKTIARLGGKPLLASAPVRWPLKTGVAPVEQEFDMRPEDADALEKETGPVTLEMTSNSRTRRVEQLWIMEVRPGPNPFIRRVRVADRRWFIRYGIIDRGYNMRRNIGFERVAAIDTLELQPVAEKAWYKPWSMNPPNGVAPGEKWTAKAMLEDAFEAAQESERRFTGRKPPTVTFTPEIKSTEREISIESLRLRGQADSELDRALSYLPEAAFYIDDAGNWIVFSRVSGKEKALVEMIGPGMVTSGHIRLVSNARTRPRKVVVHFEMEVEVRYDALEPAEGATVTDLVDERQLENVAPSPDWQLTAADGVPGDDAPIVQGTYVEFNRLLTYWGAPPGVGGNRLSYTVIRKAFVPFLDLSAALRITGERDPDADWAARIGAIEAHFRQTYRINPRWVDKTDSIRARRVGTVHVASGKGAPAEAYTDYFKLGTQRSFHKNLNGGQSLAYGYNVSGYPTGPSVGGVNSFTEDSKPAPAEVSILDEDQGIVRVEFKPDPLKLHQMFLPSILTRVDGSSFTPTGNPKDLNGAISFDAVTSPGRVPILAAQHRLCIIVSQVPAAPNDERKLYPLSVNPEDVKELLPDGARRGLADARGPEMHVRVSGGLEGIRALIRWVDSRYQDIEKIFGVREGEPNLEGLVVNREKTNVGKGKGAALNAVAKRLAAQIYARFSDHYEGEAAMPLNPDAKLDGWVDELSHEIGTNGTGQTTVRMPDKGVEVELESLLDGPTRELIHKQPQRP